MEARASQPSSGRFLRGVALASGMYDVLLGLVMLLGRSLLAGLLAVPSPSPPVHADLNGLFLVAIGLGYWLPWRDPVRYRGYLWVMGPGLKGAGAALFLLDHFLRGSPAAYLAFALTDGTLGLLTYLGLARDEGRMQGQGPR